MTSQYQPLVESDWEEEQQLKQERLRFFVRLTERCVEVLGELQDKEELRGRYAKSETCDFIDFYVITYLSDRTLLMEVVAKFNQAEVEFTGSHRFSSHPDFEKVIEKYTRTAKKPNLVLEKSRPWDVAVNLVMKVEALNPEYSTYYRRLLKREHAILEYLWNSYLEEKCDFEDMTGIPMVFDFQELLSERFRLQTGGTVEEIDLYGRMVHRKPGYSGSTLSYMTIEKLGPSISYVIDLKSIAKRQPIGLSVSSALKMFDQLICRLLTIHRFGIVHNGICPQNLYFGRGICCNVVYLNNFRAATLVADMPGVKPAINMHVAKDIRFASLNMMKATDMHPVDDIESAFYTLLASVGVCLPWDHLIQQSKAAADPSAVSDDSSANTEQCAPAVGPAAQNPPAREYYAAIRAAKITFWDSNIQLERYIANLMRRLGKREFSLFPVIAGILQDLYSKVKRLITTNTNKSSMEFSAQLCRGGPGMQLYTELRKPGLMLFKFEKPPAFLNNLAFTNRQTTLTKGVEDQLVGWNLSEWCFNCVEVRPPQQLQQPQSRMPAESICRPA